MLASSINLDQGLNQEDCRNLLSHAFQKLGSRKKILIVPPDITRLHSRAGMLSCLSYQYWQNKIKMIMPALGTHTPMTTTEMATMFPGLNYNLFTEHKWRSDTIKLGEVPASFLKELSGGKLNFSWPVEINRKLIEEEFDLIISIGQVVPHEVIGMANYNKNIFIGLGGAGSIAKSHYLGAVHGIEKTLGKIDTPVRRLLNYAQKNFIPKLPLLWIQTVVGKAVNGKKAILGLFISQEEDAFLEAAKLSRQVNISYVDSALDTVIAYLDPSEYRSTWLGNKAIYRSRKIIRDGGQLIILAPGVKEFGEDREIDRLIQKYGYLKNSKTLKLVAEGSDLADNLAVAAHLMHSSAEGRFHIRYCAPKLGRLKVEQAGFEFGKLQDYPLEKLKTGYNDFPGKGCFFIDNPGAGLWSIS